MTPAERAALDAAMAMTDPDRRLAALARLCDALCCATAPPSKDALDTVLELLDLEARKPAPARELVSVRWEVLAVHADDGALHPFTKDGRDGAHKMARGFRRSKGITSVHVIRITRYRWEKC